MAAQPRRVSVATHPDSQTKKGSVVAGPSPTLVKHPSLSTGPPLPSAIKKSINNPPPSPVSGPPPPNRRLSVAGNAPIRRASLELAHEHQARKSKDVDDVPFIYKHEEFPRVREGSRVGLDEGLEVVDGVLTDSNEAEKVTPLHSALHRKESILHRKESVNADHHAHHRVQIDREVHMVDLPEPEKEPPKEKLEIPHSVFHPENMTIGPSEAEIASQIIDADIELPSDKYHRRVQIGKGTLKTLQEIYQKDEKRQNFLVESVLAAQHVKDLTSRYGSKQKDIRQFFLEAVDHDTRVAVFGPQQLDDVGEGLSKLQERRVKPIESSMLTLDMEHKPSSPNPLNELDQSLTIVREYNKDAKDEEKEPLVGVWSKKNFWESLERLEMEQDPDTTNFCSEKPGNPLYEIYGPKWKRSRRQMQATELDSKKSSVIAQEFEQYPDKYLEVGVQEVQQSEAVRRLWKVVNEQLETFSSKDPSAYEMFGCLYDEVRNFVKLPEDDIMEFNKGNWGPEPLDEKEILSLEPYEKLRTRFAVFQKAFCFMAQHFEALTPIFSEIKQAYEDVFEKGEKEALELEKEQMEELELQKTLGNHVRQTDKAGHRLLMETKAEAHALQDHIQWQHHTLHTILGMLWKMRASLKLTSWAVTQLKNLHKSKIEALAKEIVNTQGQMMFDMSLPGKYTEFMRRIRDQSDPKEIRRMLLAARRQLRVASRKIIVFEADYADTVPKTEFEIPQKKFNLIKQKNNALTEACDKLKNERTLRKQGIAALKSQIYETSGLVKDLQRKPTPRPSWTKISYDWPGGQSKFNQIKEGQSTRQVINKVVEELSGKKVGEMTKYIQPEGKDEHVPIFLRYDKPLLQRNFTAQEALLLIKDIWKKRVDIVRLYRIIKQARKDEEEGNASFPDDLPYEYPNVGTFAEYVNEYFTKRCHLEQMRFEWIYNMMEACKRYPSDGKLVQFKGVLDGSIDESIYHLFQMELERLQDFLYSKANESYDHKGYLQWPDLIVILRTLCPNKTEEEITQINGLGATSYGVRGSWAVVRAQSLFEPDEDGKESDFVNVLYDQFEVERKEYIRDIYMEMLTELGISEKLLEHEDDPVWQTDVSMHMFYACVLSVDQTLPDVKMINYIAWVFLRVTALPGVTSLSMRLVDFLKARQHLTEAELEKYNEDEDVEFENCIKEIKDYEEDEAMMDKLDLKKRRQATKKLRYASLRQVMDGLYSGPFVRHGERIMRAKYEEEKPEKEEEKKEKRHHHHKHKHRHHRDKEHKHKHHRKSKPDDDEEEGDVDFVFNS